MRDATHTAHLTMVKKAAAEGVGTSLIAYWRLVQGVASGELHPDPDDVIRTIEAADKDLDAYDRDLAIVEKRFALLAGLEQAQRDQAEAVRLDAEIVRLKAWMEEAVNTYAANREKFNRESLRLQSISGPIIRGVGALVKECPYPHLQAEYKAALDARFALIQSRDRVAGEVRECTIIIEARDSFVANKNVVPEQLRQRTKHALTDLPGLQSRLAEIEPRIREADAEVERIEAEMAKP